MKKRPLLLYEIKWERGGLCVTVCEPRSSPKSKKPILHFKNQFQYHLLMVLLVYTICNLTFLFYFSFIFLPWFFFSSSHHVLKNLWKILGLANCSNGTVSDFGVNYLWIFVLRLLNENLWLNWSYKKRAKYKQIYNQKFTKSRGLNCLTLKLTLAPTQEFNNYALIV